MLSKAIEKPGEHLSVLGILCQSLLFCGVERSPPHPLQGCTAGAREEAGFKMGPRRAEGLKVNLRGRRGVDRERVHQVAKAGPISKAAKCGYAGRKGQEEVSRARLFQSCFPTAHRMASIAVPGF